MNLEQIYKEWNDKSPKVMGEWIFFKDKLTIENLVVEYVVWLETIDSSIELSDWIDHLKSKPDGWDFENFNRLLTYAIEWNFHDLVERIFYPSGNNIKWRE
jgi:hypothetical protein